MRLVLDIETNGLVNPTKVWLVVCKDIDTNQLYVFKPFESEDELRKCREFITLATTLVTHNGLEYDLPVLRKLCDIGPSSACQLHDTLVISRLVEYSRAPGHSLEAYGEEFGYPKITFSDFSKYTPEMETYCVRDVDLTHLVYNRYLPVVDDSAWYSAIALEQQFQSVVNSLHDNGFGFDTDRATRLLSKVEKELKELDDKILEAFPPREVVIKEFTPKATKFGTISKTSVPRSLHGRMHEFEVGQTYPLYGTKVFNPSSHKQLIEVLHEAGWRPVNKTKTHLELERTLQRNRYSKTPLTVLDLAVIECKLKTLKKYGYKIDEDNLGTLPPKAPPAARLLARRILLESRRRTLTEWLGLVSPEARVHGKFYGIGAWTHRMAHQAPNTANIPSEYNINGTVKLYGKEMRQLWIAPKKKLLVGVDAEGIQLRIFAHYIDDKEFTRALVEGKKDDKTDPHSLNQRILGSVCKSRAAAKRFIYALLLGAGIGKLTEILECSVSETREAMDRLLLRYTGFARLKAEVLPQDGRRGFLIGLDGRKVSIPGDTASARTHLAMSGYLQNGEAVVMKKACLLWHERLNDEYGNTISLNSTLSNIPSVLHTGETFRIVNFVHDEWQTEVPNDMSVALKVAKIQAESLRIVGEELGLKCPLAGSYWNDDHKDYTIGTNWYQTH